MSLLNAYPELASIDAWISATDAKRADIAAQVSIRMGTWSTSADWTMVKPFWFVLAAYAVVAVYEHARTLALAASASAPAQQSEHSTSKVSWVRSSVLAGAIGEA